MITALILAGGQSKRMGQPKMLLPWGETTVLGQVIGTLQRAGLGDILVVTGGAREQVEKIAAQYAARSTHNPNYASGEMLSSIQIGLQALTTSQPPPDPQEAGWMQTTHSSADLEAVAALVVLGDQPQVQEGIVRAVVDAFEAGRSNLVVPSYRMRRGHPWLVARPFWEEILSMQGGESPREFLNRHAGEIQYVNVDTPSILLDLDTFEDYLKSRP